MDNSVEDMTMALEVSTEHQLKRIALGQSAIESPRPGSFSNKRAMEIQKRFYQQWSLLLATANIFSVSMDPLLLYILLINDNMKCLVFDKKLKKIALILRSFADLSFIGFIILVIPTIVEAATKTRGTFKVVKSVLGTIWHKTYIPLYTVAVLPITQIAILGFFPTVRSSTTSLSRMKIMNSLILLQYVLRIRPVYLYMKVLNRQILDNTISEQIFTTIWVPSCLNFLLYILAIHVLGAFWYFFSIQRVVECWGYACRSENRCEFNIFDCDHIALRNITLLNDLCPINPSNATIFNFGIYLDALQSGLLGSTNFPEKFLQCFSWGVRNLSSFASNLKTSNNTWETLFVVFISISGLLLFIYLLGHLQVSNRKVRISRKIRTIYSEVKCMSCEYGLGNVEGAISKIVRKQLQTDEDLSVKNIFSILPRDVKEIIKRHLFLATLKKVPMLGNIDEKVLNAVLEHLEPINYTEGSYIIREGEPLDVMLFVAQGIALAYKTSNTGRESGSSSTTHLARGDFYGEKLISWAVASTPLSGLPISDKTIKSHEKVEVFVIRATSLQRIVSKFLTYFSTELPQPADSRVVQIVEDGNI